MYYYIVCFALWLAAALFGGESVNALYLSWYGDPTTTMTIQWHTPPDDTSDAIVFTIPGIPDGQQQQVFGTHVPFPGEPLLIHTASLDQLSPDTEYRFQIGNHSETYFFRTAPATLDKPMRFIIGGDLYGSAKLFRKMSQTAASLDPLFAVLGGDIAYALHKTWILPPKSSRQWRSFFADWSKYMRAPDGRLIPLLAVPGNHDISPSRYELFFAVFAFPQQTLYRAVDFGSFLSLFLLDTGHFHPIEGQQTAWLKEALADRQQRPFRFAIYHVGAYPSFYSYSGSDPTKIRASWCPLFDQYHVQACFEHHSHAYKKTYPLKGNQKDPSGTIYFGDGAWGVSARRTHDAWYLSQRKSQNNIYLVELTHKSASIKAIDITGAAIDQSTVK